MKLLFSTLLTICAAALYAAGRKRLRAAKPVYGNTNPTPEQASRGKVKHLASIVELRPEKEQYYRELHANVWPEVVGAIKKANIQNYNIFVAEIGEKKYLFSCLEYVGDNVHEDFARMAEDATTKNRWWPEAMACLKRLPGTPDDEQWLGVEMIMHID